MPNTMELIASSTVGSGGAANISFTSIPSTYTDLVIKLSGKTGSFDSNANDAINLSFNGSTASFTARVLFGTGSSTGSLTNSYYGGLADSSTANAANTFGNAEIYIPNYAGSTNKSFSADGVSEANQTAAISVLTAGLWSNTAAITSITLTPSVSTFVQYSTAYLYGVKNA